VAKYETEFLVRLHQETNFKLLAIEDRASLISSGELAAFIQKPDGQQGMILISLANGERGPVIAVVEYAAPGVGDSYYHSQYLSYGTHLDPRPVSMDDDVRDSYRYDFSAFWYGKR
jgi:hypothetical protein